MLWHDPCYLIVKQTLEDGSLRSCDIKIKSEFKKLENIWTMVGENCTLGSSVIVEPGIIIGRRCEIRPMKRIMKNVSSGSKVM